MCDARHRSKDEFHLLNPGITSVQSMLPSTKDIHSWCSLWCVKPFVGRQDRVPYDRAGVDVLEEKTSTFMLQIFTVQFQSLWNRPFRLRRTRWNVRGRSHGTQCNSRDLSVVQRTAKFTGFFVIATAGCLDQRQMDIEQLLLHTAWMRRITNTAWRRAECRM
jgi:hypothetical protein